MLIAEAGSLGSSSRVCCKGKTLKIASWNVNSLNVRLGHLLSWCESTQPDVVALQETKLIDEKFPVEQINEAGYRVAYSGQKTYNGVAILSKSELADVATDIDGLDDPQRRILAATIGDVRVLNLYVVNGKAVGSDKYDYKLEWLSKVHEYIRQQLVEYPKMIVLGDFNIAPDDRDVHKPERWVEKILCSTPEREALTELLQLGFHDTFRLFEQPEKIFSWWDYRLNGYARGWGLRIDLVLASEALKELCTASYVDKAPREWERPSDHAPAIAEFDF